MLLDHNDFKKEISRDVKQVFAVWQDNLKGFKEQIRQQTSRIKDKSGIQLLNLERGPLRERIENIITFRHHHQKLKQIISKTLNKENAGGNANGDGVGVNSRNFEEQALNDINEAYSLFLNINVLDVTKEG